MLCLMPVFLILLILIMLSAINLRLWVFWIYVLNNACKTIIVLSWVSRCLLLCQESSGWIIFGWMLWHHTKSLKYIQQNFFVINYVLVRKNHKWIILDNVFLQLGFSTFSDSNRSNDWQKVQYTTNLLKQRQINLYTNESVN
jgi:hypothetical protein